LHHRESGSGTPPVIVLHGIMGHAREWDVLVAALATRHRVVAVDQRGHGESDWATEYTATAMGRDVAGLVERHGLAPVDLIGHSLGGMVAAVCAAERPELVRRLVLVDVGPD